MRRFRRAMAAEHRKECGMSQIQQRTEADLTDPARRRARFHYPKVAFNRPIPRVAAHAFVVERDLATSPSAPTGFVPLDRSEALNLPWPATLPTMLARYLVIRPGETFPHELQSTGETYYVLTGEGVSENGDDPVRWREGDAFCLAGGRRTQHRAMTHSVLFLCTNEPELRYAHAGVNHGDPVGVRPTLFGRAEVAEQLKSIQAAPSDDAAGKAVILVTEAMSDRIAATPTLSITFNSLEPGGDQRAHKHSSAALTLSIEGDGVYSMVDGERVDWVPGLVMLTPPGAPHSHHNRGRQTMLSFVVQDSPLHAQMRTTNFQFIA